MSGSRLVGVAIVIPDPLAAAVESCRARSGDPLAAHITPHITLVPPTPVPARAWEEVNGHVRAVAASHRVFEICLSGTGTFWPVSEVAYVALSRGESECDELQRTLRTGVLRRHLDFPYHPHVTLAHNVGESAMVAAAAELATMNGCFEAREIGLFENAEDGSWQAIAAYPLRPMPSLTAS